MRIVVGIPSFQEADSIAFVTARADEGLARFGDSVDCVIVNADGNSPDDTTQVFLSTPTRSPKVSLVTPDHRGKGSNVRTLFKYCLAHDVDALALLDGDVRSVTEDWPMRLTQPIIEGEAEYVTPLYLRQRFEGGTTNHFAYPLITSFFGRRIRQPIGGEFGLSRSLISYLLEREWRDETFGYGIDIFMSMHALGGGFRIVQVPLGRKIHKPSLPKMSRIFPDVVASAFGVIRQYQMSDNTDESSPRVAIDDFEVQPNDGDARTRVISAAVTSAGNLLPVYEQWLGSTAAARRLREQVLQPADRVLIKADEWAELAAACASQAIFASPSEDRLLADQLYPAGVIRLLSFGRENHNRSATEVEAEISRQLSLFDKALRSRISQGSARHSS